MGKITIKVETDTSNYETGLKKMRKETKEFEVTTKTLVKSLSTLFAGVSFKAFVGELKEVAAAARDYADDIDRMSLLTGVAHEDMSVLSFAFRQNKADLAALSAVVRM